MGSNNQLPWHLPGDLKYFKEMTMGKPIIMGRKTFESIGRPLPGRRNIVITRNIEYKAEGIETAPNLETALALVRDAEEIMIIGGEQIFKLALPMAEKLYVTLIDYEFPGDTYFPVYDGWTVTSSSNAITAEEGYTFKYCILEKE